MRKMTEENIFNYFKGIIDGEIELDNGEKVSISKQLDDGALLCFNPTYLKYSIQEIQMTLFSIGQLEKLFDGHSTLPKKNIEFYFGTLGLFEEKLFEDKRWILRPIEILEKLEKEERDKILEKAYIKLSKESDFKNLKEITTDQFLPLLMIWEFIKVYRDKMKIEIFKNLKDENPNI